MKTSFVRPPAVSAAAALFALLGSLGPAPSARADELNYSDPMTPLIEIINYGHANSNKRMADRIVEKVGSLMDVVRSINPSQLKDRDIILKVLQATKITFTIPQDKSPEYQAGVEQTVRDKLFSIEEGLKIIQNGAGDRLKDCKMVGNYDIDGKAISSALLKNDRVKIGIAKQIAVPNTVETEFLQYGMVATYVDLYLKQHPQELSSVMAKINNHGP